MQKIWYKIVKEKDGQYITLFHKNNGSRIIEKGKWLKAKKEVTDGSKKTSTKYSGWHIMPSIDDIDKILKLFKHKDDKLFIKCYATGIRPKSHSQHQVFLADEIFVLSETPIRYGKGY